MMSDMNNLQERITRLLEQLNQDMHEREQILALSLLGAITGLNTFLYGPPGTAKSLISRRLSQAFDSPNYFECLMNRFTTPEEIFGPVSIRELKEDNYVRKVDGYLPTADFAFLDEIWKSSPAILNSLLTIINEHVFKNGVERIDVPLKSLIVASNEVPESNQGLDALYDRFIIRLLVPPIQDKKHFFALLDSQPSTNEFPIDPSLKISNEELLEWREQLHHVKLSEDTILIIKYIYQELLENIDDWKVYISDRRWQRTAMLLKASAFCNNRTETNLSDVILLKYCLWTSPENRVAVENLVMKAIRECGLNIGINIARLDEEKSAIEDEIHTELYYSEDIYDTITLNNAEFFKVQASFKYRHNNFNKKLTFYIPVEKFKSPGKFHPIDEHGNSLTEIECDFNTQGTCTINYNSYGYNQELYPFTPKIRHHSGKKKENINPSVVESLRKSIQRIHAELIQAQKKVSKKIQNYQDHLNSPFVSEQEIKIALESISEQIHLLELRILDCLRLERECQ